MQDYEQFEKVMKPDFTSRPDRQRNSKKKAPPLLERLFRCEPQFPNVFNEQSSILTSPCLNETVPELGTSRFRSYSKESQSLLPHLREPYC